MSKRDDLRRVRSGTVINVSSKKMESELVVALTAATGLLSEKYDVNFEHQQNLPLGEIAAKIKLVDPSASTEVHFETSFLKPDGGILYMVDNAGVKYPIIVSEAKRQGTNDLLEAEGKKKQAKGNAIERLGKNVIGFRSWFSGEDIFPFVVFGEGVDFASDSSILDRVSTIAQFAPLNRIEVIKEKNSSLQPRGCFYFREEKWSPTEMQDVLFEIGSLSIEYYFKRKGENTFRPLPTAVTSD